MGISATYTTHGAASFDALAEVVRAAKAGDALAPVTVIVPTNTAGVMARRALGRRGGAAAVDVLTLYRVAELLGARSLVDEGRRPVSTPIVDVAVKDVLRRTPGLYVAVARHPSTVVALRDLYREVRLAGRDAMTALGRTGRGREPARVLTDVARALARDWYDEGDLLEQAATHARRERPARFARVVVHAPERVRPLELELLRALGEIGDVRLLVPRTGDDEADGLVLQVTAQLTGTAPPALPSAAPPAPPVGQVRVVSTTDADEEVRVGVRALLDAARAGTPFDRMALLWPTDRPYARLAEHHLAAAELPWNGRPGMTVLERMVPRVLAELLELDRRGLRRIALMTLLGDVPARGPDGRTVPVARWERIGRDAGIVREEDWDRQLPSWIADTRRAASDGARLRLADDADAGEALGGFVAELRAALGDPATTKSWDDWVTWTEERLERWFGPSLHRLPAAEHLAWEQTQRVLDRLRHLDHVSAPVTRAELRATFVAELEAVPARRGTIGRGVHVGSLAAARGLDLDMAVVVGAADGLLPPPPVIDPLLGDDDRVRAGLVTSDERVRNAHRQFLAVTQTTPAVTVVIPRGDLRATMLHHPSRWVAGRLGDHGGPLTVETVDSHAHGLASTDFPVSTAEHRRRELWVHARQGGDVRTHERLRDDDAARRALALRDARASGAFTEYDGDLSARTITVFDQPIAPTRLEAWSTCPHAFFVRYVLGVRPIDEPGDLLTIDPRDRGSAVHAALHQLQRGVLDGTVAPPGPDGWSSDHATVLAELTMAIADELERGGRTGRPAYWVTARELLLAEVERWVEVDRAAWQGRQLRFSEQAFGHDGGVTLRLPDGRAIAVRGSIDRVDELADGSLLVTDHKTGKPDKFKKLAEDPTLGGTHFQLPVYAAAARVLTGQPDVSVHAEYAFFQRGEFKRYRATLDAAAWELASAQLAEVVAGIEAGVFPPRPDAPGWQLFVPCPFCDPDDLGTTERYPEWERKQRDPRLARWFGADDQPEAS